MRPWFLSLSRAGTAVGLLSLALAGCETDSPELQPQTTPVVTAPDGGLLAPDASAPVAPGSASLRSGEIRLADFTGHYDGTRFVIDSVKPAAEPVEGFSLMSREQQLCIMNIQQDGVPGSGPVNSVELVTESQARNAACPAPYDTVPSLCANVTLRSFYADRTRTDVYVRLDSLTTPLANPVLNSAASTPGLPSGLGIWSYGNIGLAGTPQAAVARDWVFQTTGASFSFTGSVVTNMAELANGLDDDCDLRIDEGIAAYADGIACVDNTDCTSTLCQGGICAPTTCSNGALDPGETDLDCGGVCGASCVGDKICTVGTDCITGQCVAGFCLGSTGDVCAGNASCLNQVCNPNIAVANESIAFAPEIVAPNATVVTTSAGATLGDESYSGAIPLGFGFNFYGNRYTNIYVSSNGWASFTAPTSAVYIRSAIPSTSTPNNMIAFWWGDLNPGAGGTITSQTIGTAPNRKFVLNFDQVADYTSGGTPATVQLVLNETSNAIDIHCTNCSNGGSVARVQGVENVGGTSGLATNGVNNVATSLTNTSIRYRTVTPDGFCAAPTCSDAVKNGNETATDCGGLCGSNCADGLTCNQNSDCLRGNCTAGICISCFDGIKNQTEGDTDCGGTCTVRCGSSQTCNVTADCISGICDASNICVPTGDPGDACVTDNDCDSRVCDAGGPGAQAGYPLNLNGLVTAGTALTLTDDSYSSPIPLGFDFPFFDTTQTQVIVASNGWLTFASTTTSFAGTIPSTSAPNGVISFFGRDLNPATGGTITYATTGTAPNREFVLNYNNIPDYGTAEHPPVTVQVALQETTGYIDIRCVSCVSNAATAIVGVENMAGTLGVPMPGTAYSAVRNLTNTTTRFQTVTRPIGVCQAPTCTDVTNNQDESGIDCGGTICAARCGAGQACIAGTDCTSTRCENALCSTCSDGVKSGTETDVDCGGVCGSTCTDTKTCSVNADCASNRCEGGICTSCADGVKNGTETDLDCGGICGGTCLFANTCSVNGDCYTNNCTGGLCGKGATGANCGGGNDCTSAVCVPGISKGVSDTSATFSLVPTTGFTAVTFTNADDGTALLPIGFNFPFFTGTFTELSLSSNGLFAFGATASTTYSAALGSTATPNNFVTFFNRDLNATNATITSGSVGTAPNRKFVIDIQNLEDYYFSTPDHDPISLQIQLNETTGYIDLMYIAANSAATTVRIGAEGPSVGGAVPDFVALTGYNPGSTNFVNQAVRIGTFNQYPGLCAAPSCSDATKNQAETDVDCGGECGANCGIGKLCGTANDCDPGGTGVAECLLVGTSTICMNCSDGTKNGNEADVDCGGSCAADCVSGQTCGANSDCDSNLCVGGLCAGCADAVQNGGETDVDCGGPDCGPCFGGKICTADADCLSGSCVGGFCALGATAAACNQGDQCLNGVCGGGTIPTSNGITITYNPDPSINDITAGTRATTSSSSTARLGESKYSAPVPIGFPFRFFDSVKTSVNINGGGFVAFDNGITGGSTGPFVPPTTSPNSTSLPNQILAPFWFDGNPSLRGAADSDVRYLTTGVAPNRRFIVNWIGVAHYALSSDHATFQLVLYENGQYADFFCKDCTLSATGTYGNRAQLVEGTPAPTAAAPSPAIVALSAYPSGGTGGQVLRSLLNIPNNTARRYFTNATQGASCLAPTCNDGVKNQGETDVDCGGAACGATCAPTKACSADTDCAGLGASCSGGVCRNCSDGVLNGQETGLDCGGQCGATCGGGQACNSGADCATSGCTGGLCNLGVTGESCTAGNQCADGVCGRSISSVPYAPYTLTGAATTLAITGDDVLVSGITLPFAFNYFGTSYTTIGVASDGWLSFTATLSDFTPDTPTGSTGANTATPNALIAYYWADVRRPTGATGTYKTETFGTAPNRVWVMEASNLNTNGTTATSDVTCQVQLFETTNVAEIHCLKASNTANGAAAQRFENAAGTQGFAISSARAYSSPGAVISTPEAIRFASNVQTCKAPTTTDGVKNGTETDVDCGGTSGVLCAPTKLCLANTDCAGTGASCTGGTCRNCSDTVKNGTETDVDCGGICGGNCGFNKICAANTDCASQNCAGGLCGLSADGLACSAAGDCASGFCDGKPGPRLLGAVTQVGTFDDGLGTSLSGDDSSASVQLGFKFKFFGNEFSTATLSTNGYLVFSGTASGYGANLPTAAAPNNLVALWWNDLNATAAGQIRYYTTGTAPFRKFVVNYNGLNHYSSGNPINAQMVLHETLNYIDLTCINCAVDADAHYQGVENATGTFAYTTETNGSSSAAITNRTVRYVTDGGSPICAPATCGDGTLNGSETGVDCGSTCLSDCTKGVACSGNADCLSGNCALGACAGIADAAACTLSSACNSGVCTAGACAAPACNDGVLNGLESDLDCGGSFCGATCAAGKACGVATDCAANRCEGNLCRTCGDGLKTGTETDVDCGGVCVSGAAGKCGLGKICSVNSDCGSGNCQGGLCVVPPFDCFDGQKGPNDVNETDVDCGGSDCSARCLIGKACLVGGDCASGVCTGGVCATADTGGSCYSGADCNSGVCGGASAPTAVATSYQYTDPTVGTGWTTVAGLSADDTIDTTIFSGTFNFRLPTTVGGSQFNSYTVATATSNGWFGFGSSTGLTATTYGLTLPNATRSPIVGLYAADSGSATAASNGTMRYKTFGTAPYRKYVYDITNHPSTYNGAVTFTAQIVLYETLNIFDVLCKSCSASSAHTQGFNAVGGATAAFVTGRNNAVFTATNDAVRFNPAPGLSCQAPTNTDGVKNGTETDIDCGGTSGKLCGFNKVCSAGADCMSAECSSGLCAKSTFGEVCGAAADCLGANCASNVCGIAGGGAGCLINSDCASANCDTSGGTPGVCGKLAVGASCAVNTDCQSNFCAEDSAATTAPGAYPATFAAVTRPACGTTLASGSTVVCTTAADTALTAAQTLPFTFKFFDANYTQFKISADGTMTFDTAETLGPNGASTSTNMLSAALPTSSETLPTTGTNTPGIALYQLDGQATAANSLRYWYEGTAGNYVAYITFEAVPHYLGAASGGTVTGVIILNQADNSVELQVESGTQGTTAGSRARGIRNVNGSMAFYLYPSGTHYNLTNENGSQFVATNNRVKYYSNAAPKICATAGSSGAPCTVNADCGSNSCVPAASSVALAAPGTTPPANWWTSGFVANTNATTTVGYPTITGTSLPVALGFPFTAFNQKFTDVRVATSGYLSFLTGTSTSSATGGNLLTTTTTSQNGVVAYWWRANNAMSATANVKVVRAGSAPNRTVTFDANLLTTATVPAPVKARVVMYERSNLIDVICYDCGTGTTAASSQGIESPGGTIRVVTQSAVTTALQNNAVRFNPNSSAVCF